MRLLRAFKLREGGGGGGTTQASPSDLDIIEKKGKSIINKTSGIFYKKKGGGTAAPTVHEHCYLKIYPRFKY